MSEHNLKTMPELGRMNTEQFKASEKFPFAVVLDNVRSMHNIGSCFRTCDAFRVEKLWLCGFTATPPHREIEKAALGATLSVDWEHADDTCEAVRRLKAEGYKVYAVEQVHGSIALQDFKVERTLATSASLRTPFFNAAPLGINFVSVRSEKVERTSVRSKETSDKRSDPKTAFVFGNEVEGVQQQVIDLCDGALEIPQFGTKHSFNVSVTIGIVLWQAYRNFL